MIITPLKQCVLSCRRTHPLDVKCAVVMQAFKRRNHLINLLQSPSILYFTLNLTITHLLHFACMLDLNLLNSDVRAINFSCNHLHEPESIFCRMFFNLYEEIAISKVKSW